MCLLPGQLLNLADLREERTVLWRLGCPQVQMMT